MTFGIHLWRKFPSMRKNIPIQWENIQHSQPSWIHIFLIYEVNFLIFSFNEKHSQLFYHRWRKFPSMRKNISIQWETFSTMINFHNLRKYFLSIGNIHDFDTYFSQSSRKYAYFRKNILFSWNHSPLWYVFFSYRRKYSLSIGNILRLEYIFYLFMKKKPYMRKNVPI
jgi:hypothetical protein